MRSIIADVLQESGNVPFVVNGGFGLYCGEHPSAVAKAACTLLSRNDLRCAMSARALALSQPGAAIEIAKDLGAFLGLAADEKKSLSL